MLGGQQVWQDQNKVTIGNAPDIGKILCTGESWAITAREFGVLHFVLWLLCSIIFCFVNTSAWKRFPYKDTPGYARNSIQKQTILKLRPTHPPGN